MNKTKLNAYVKDFTDNNGKLAMFATGYGKVTGCMIIDNISDLKKIEDIFDDAKLEAQAINNISKDGFAFVIVGQPNYRNLIENIKFLSSKESRALELKELIRVNGYEPVKKGTNIVYGCAAIRSADIVAAYQYLKSVDSYDRTDCKAPVVRFGAGLFNLATLEALVEYFKLKV